MKYQLTYSVDRVVRVVVNDLYYCIYFTTDRMLSIADGFDNRSFPTNTCYQLTMSELDDLDQRDI